MSSGLEQEEDVELSGGEAEFSPDLKLFVGNLPFSVDSSKLAGLFQRAGNVEMVEVCSRLHFDRLNLLGFELNLMEISHAVNATSV